MTRNNLLYALLLSISSLLSNSVIANPNSSVGDALTTLRAIELKLTKPVEVIDYKISNSVSPQASY